MRDEKGNMVDRLNWNGVRVLPLLLAAVALSIVTMAAFNSHAQTAKQEAAAELFDEGFKLYQSGDFYAAKDSFETGLELSPTNPAAHYYLGRILEQQGDFGGARASYEAAIANGADTKEGILAQSKLKGLDQRVGDRALTDRIQRVAGRWCRRELETTFLDMGLESADREHIISVSVANGRIDQITLEHILHNLTCASGIPN